MASSPSIAGAVAQRPELSQDTTVWTQYYHCVIRNIPFEMAPPALADHLMVQGNSEAAKALAALGRHITLHTMYTYKEALSTKFGYLGFFLRCTSDAIMDEETKGKAHALVKQWIEKELSVQLLIGGMKVTLAQPAACYHARPFLKAFRERCSIASKEVSADPMKVETFLFTHVDFGSHDVEAHRAFNPTGARQGESFEERTVEKPESVAPAKEWAPVGTLSMSSFTPQELLWLKKNCSAFPPISITDGDVKTAHVDSGALVRYFTTHLSPLVVVTQ